MSFLGTLRKYLTKTAHQLRSRKMKISDNGLSLIKAAESCELEAYPDPASELGEACTHKGLVMREYRDVPDWRELDPSPVTIGWGHTGKDIKLGMEIDQERANTYLRMDVQFAEAALYGLTLNQNQFDALCSLVFNIGAGAFARSTLRKDLARGAYEAAADQFLRWDHAGGRALSGLTKRRKAERALFLTPVAGRT